jgi:hypothetical protein
MQENIDIQIKIVDSPYMTADIFLECLRGIEIPAVKGNRLIPGWANRPALTFCDNDLCHCDENVMRE